MDQATWLEAKGDIALSRLLKLKSEALSLRMAGLAMSQAWVYTVLFSRGLSPEVSDPASIHSSFYEVSLVALVAMLLVAGLTAVPIRSLMETPVGPWIPGLLCAGGTIVLPFGSPDALSSAALMGGAVATGVGSGLLQVSWGRSFARVGGPAAAGEAAVAFGLASLVTPVFLFFPPWFRLAAAVALVVGSSAALSVVVHRDMAAEQSTASLDDHEPKTETDKEGARHPDPIFNQTTFDSRNSLRNEGLAGVFVRLMISSLVLGACTSTMQGFFISPDAASHDLMYAIAMPVASLLSSAMLIGTLLFSQRLDVAFTYQPVVPIIVLGCFASLFLERGSIIACSLVLVSYQLFGLINWTLLANFSYYHDTPSIRIFGLGRASLSGGVLSGHMLLAALQGLGGFSFEQKAALLMAVIFAASIACTFIFTPRTLAQTLRRQWLRLPPREAILEEALDPAGTELTLDEKIEIIAREYEITGRMLEVFELMAHGRTGTRIEQELYMSKGTVKTHTRRIYQKLDVHSKQEMLDLIEGADA